MAVENYDAGVTRKSFDEITEQDRLQARLNVDPTGTRFDAATGQWTETFMPEYVDRVYGQGGGYYAPKNTADTFGADDYWTDTKGAFGDTGYANPFGVPVEGPTQPQKPKAPDKSDAYKEY